MVRFEIECVVWWHIRKMNGDLGLVFLDPDIDLQVQLRFFARDGILRSPALRWRRVDSSDPQRSLVARLCEERTIGT